MRFALNHENLSWKLSEILRKIKTVKMINSVDELFKKLLQDKGIATFIKIKSERDSLKRKDEIKRWKKNNPEKILAYAKNRRG
jgi:hypothetical protein